MVLTPRIRKILLMLLDSSETVSARELAHAANASLRCIRYDLKALREMQEELDFQLISIPGQGTRIEASCPEKLRQRLGGLSLYQAPMAPCERQKWLIVSALLAGEKKVDDLAVQFEVSISTIYRDLKNTETKLPEGLLLVLQAGVITILGSEGLKRSTLVEQLTGLAESLDVAEQRQIITFPQGDVDLVHHALELAQEKLGFKLADSSYQQLSFHLLVAMHRLRAGHPVVVDDALGANITCYSEYATAGDIASLLSEATGLQFPDAEIAYIAINLLGSKVRERPGIASEDQDVGIVARNFVAAFEAVHGTFGLSSDAKLLEDLTLHLRPALRRVNYKLPVNNPLLKRLQTEFSDIFQSARIASSEVPETMALNEDELSFLVMHLAAALERIKQPHTIKAVIICSTGLGSARLLSERIARRFPIIQVVAIASAVEQDFPPETEVVISTVPLRSDLPVVHVSPLLIGDEIARLEKFVYGGVTRLGSQALLNSILAAIRRNCVIIDEAKLLQDMQMELGITATPAPQAESLPGLAKAIQELEQAFDTTLHPDVVSGLTIHFQYTARRLEQGQFWQEPHLDKQKLNPRWPTVQTIIEKYFKDWNLPWSEHELPPIIRYFQEVGGND